MKLSENISLRRIAMPLLKMFGRDITIRHPWVSGGRVFLNSFKHKGYWYHGKKREKSTMELFTILVQEGSTVVEVGGHIGYISMFFAFLVGPRGKVFVFEPGSNNLPYIRRNILGMEFSRVCAVELIEKAVGAENSIATIYEDSLTGQNNSLVRNFAGLRNNAGLAFVKTEIQARMVPVVTLDSFLDGNSANFIKIDVEGFEWSVLRGASKTIESLKPAVMVEVQADEEKIFDFFAEKGYLLFNELCMELRSPELLKGNIFCLHMAEHADSIGRLRAIRSHPNAK